MYAATAHTQEALMPQASPAAVKLLIGRGASGGHDVSFRLVRLWNALVNLVYAYPILPC